VNTGKHPNQALRVVAETSPRPDLVVVLGMHRAGTSALARGLKALGVELGDRMMAPSATENPTGYWEDLDIYELNMSMMKALGRDWHSLHATTRTDVDFLKRSGYMLRASELLISKTQDIRTFGFKDPRLAVLLPFWKEVFAARLSEVAYLIAVRNPLSVTRSLATRNALASEKSYYLWLEHMLPSLDVQAGARQIVMDYDCLMAAPREQLQRVANAFGMELDEPEVAQYESEFLDSSLRHTEYTVADLELDPACPPLVADVYRELHALARLPGCLGTEQLASKLTSWQRDLDTLQPALDFADGVLRKLESATSDLTARNLEAAELQLGLRARSTELEAARQAMSTLSARASELEIALEARNATIRSLDTEGERLQQLQDQLSAHGNEMAQREAAIVGLQLEINALRDAATGREGLIMHLQEELECDRHAAVKAASAYQQLLVDQRAMSHRVTDAEVEHKRLQAALAKARSDAAMQATLLEQRETALAKAQVEIEAMRGATTLREASLDRLQHELKASQLAADRASTELNALVRRVEADQQAASQRTAERELEHQRVVDALLDAQRDAASQSAAMERALDEARQREESLRGDLSREASALTQARAQVDHLAMALGERDASIEALRATLDTFDASLEELTLQSAELDRQIALSAERHVSDMAVANESVGAITAQYDAARHDLSVANVSLEARAKSLASLNSDLQELQQRSHAVEQENARLLDKLRLSIGEATELRSRFEILSATTSERVDLMGRQLTDERIAKEEFVRMLIDANTRIDQLRSSWSWRVMAPFRALGRRRW
jgi:hypothetical protein